MSEAKKWTTVGSMRQSEKGNYYLKIDEAIPAGSVIQMQKPKDKIERLVALGKMTQDEADERLNKIPSYVKFDLVLPPPKDDGTF